MIPNPFKSVVFEWLSETGDAIDGTADRNFGASGWQSYPMPPECGTGGYEVLDLTLGMTYVRSTVDFSPAMLGTLMPMMEVDTEFTEPTFQAMVLHGLRGSVRERYPPAQLAISPGIDLFRYTRHYRSMFTADASFSGETCHVSIGRSVLGQLIGDEVACALLGAMGIAEAPGITVRPIPLHITRFMFKAASMLMTGASRKLFCQASLLEYLAALVHHVCGSEVTAPEHSQQSRNRVLALHAQLMACEGKLPTLDELAKEYGRSAKLLNEEFSHEFGKSIYAFMAEHRLSQAHAALENTPITIKQLAARLGYTHVNNFTIAFKRRFGYPPGHLRKEKSNQMDCVNRSPAGIAR